MITAGEVLKNKRELLRKSLETVSQDTKIQKRFLEYIEANEFTHFDSEVFLTGFIKIYAQYLDIDTDKVLAIYRRSNPSRKLDSKNPEIKKNGTSNGKKKWNILNPNFLATSLIIIFLISIFGYIGFQIYKFQSPPDLEIEEPTQESEFSTEKITVKGKSEINTIVEINGTPTEIDEEGNFSEEIALKEGVNIINIKARKNSNNTLETLETRKVTYTKVVITEEEKIQEIAERKLVLEIVDTAAWIKLDVDDENKVSQVVEPSRTEYPLTSKLHIISGRASSTKLYWGEELIPWKQNQTSGVVELICQLVDSKVVCE